MHVCARNNSTHPIDDEICGAAIDEHADAVLKQSGDVVLKEWMTDVAARNEPVVNIQVAGGEWERIIDAYGFLHVFSVEIPCDISEKARWVRCLKR